MIRTTLLRVLICMCIGFATPTLFFIMKEEQKQTQLAKCQLGFEMMKLMFEGSETWNKGRAMFLPCSK